MLPRKEIVLTEKAMQSIQLLFGEQTVYVIGQFIPGKGFELHKLLALDAPVTKPKMQQNEEPEDDEEEICELEPNPLLKNMREKSLHLRDYTG